MGADENNVADYHAQTAQRFLERGEIAEADRHLQKAVAITNPFLHPLEDYTAALAKTKYLLNENKLESETIASMVSSKVKAKLRVEAEELHFFPKTAKLPI